MIAAGYLQRDILRRVAGGHIGEMSGIVAIRQTIKFYRGFRSPGRTIFDIQVKVFHSEALPGV